MIFLSSFNLSLNELLNSINLHLNIIITDIITLSEAPNGLGMTSKEITWPNDLAEKFIQVDGFVYQEVTNTSLSCTQVFGDGYTDCLTYYNSGTNVTYYYWYPDNDSVQYLYESYPEIVSPIEGVKNEHFINWMRTAGLPQFRKLYGKINSDISSGAALVFQITTNFEVTSFSGSKTLILTTVADYGGQNYALGNSVLIIGAMSLGIGTLFAFKRIFAPRPLGDIRHLNWK